MFIVGLGFAIINDKNKIVLTVSMTVHEKMIIIDAEHGRLDKITIALNQIK